jgi:CPA2 family monovalent cation:H+ antiporter-2
MFGWGTKPGLVIGMAMAVASTVVLLRVLLDHGILETTAGHAAVGWLIVEDILTVLVLVLIPALALESGGASALPLAIGTALFKIAALAALVLVAGGRIIPWVLVMVARLRSRELFTLTVLVIAIAIAAGSYAFFGVSMALGAFLAGWWWRKHRSASKQAPTRSRCAMPSRSFSSCRWACSSIRLLYFVNPRSS